MDKVKDGGADLTPESGSGRSTDRVPGLDLQHAANCILIAKDLHDQGENLDTQIMTATQSATAYQTTTNTLLAKITTELADNRP